MAINNTITFGGQILPCVIERYPTIRKPARKYRQYSIPGRSGDVFFQDDAWENVLQSYDVYAGDDAAADGAQVKWTDLAKYLYLNGYQILSDTYDTDHFRKAIFNGPMDIENAWNTHGRATIEFNCRPERFRIDGAVRQSFAVADANLQLWKKADLSSYLRNSVFAAVDSEDFYAVTVPSGTRRVRILNWINDGKQKRVAAIDAGTETTAESVNSWLLDYGVLVNTFNRSMDLLIPAIYFDGLPIIEIQDANYGTSIAGQAGTITNNYMPATPTIILHAEASHTGEVIAGRINNSGIYVSQYDSASPYYFIDVENFSITKAATLTGERILANNARIDTGLMLNTGENSIFTSVYYSMQITPNLWEL